MDKKQTSSNDLQLSPNQISIVTEDIESFFNEKIELQKNILPLKNIVFPPVELDVIQPTVDESKKLNKAFTKNVNKVYDFLLSNPHLCNFVVHTIPENMFIGPNPSSNLSELFTLGVLSNSLNFIEMVLSNTKSYNLKINRKYATRIHDHFDKTISTSSLYVDFSSRSNGYPFIVDDISCASAFAASQSEVFVGQTGGLIRVLSISPSGRPVIKFNLWQAVDNSPYSLCWVHDRLFMITKKQAFMINVATNEVTEIPDKPEKLIPPVCTDGHLFYSIRVLVRKGKLTIFSFNNMEFRQEDNVVLRGSIADSYSEMRIPFATDGIRITFATPRGKSTHFLEFSLESGKLINDHTLNCSTVINSWCIRPYGLEHVALTSSDISFYRSSLQVPRWLLSVPFPSSHGTLNPFLILMNALFHGSCLFNDSQGTCIQRMLESFLVTFNINGIYIAGMIFLDNLNNRNVDKCVSLFVQTFNQFNDIKLRRFCVFVFLSGFTYLENKEIYRENSIVNKYLEISDDMDFIWFFSNYFDFVTFKFSRTVVNKIMLHVSQSIRIFYSEALSIMTNCCLNYIDPIIKNHLPSDDIVIPLRAMMESVIQKVTYYMPQFTDPSDFVNSQHFEIWKFCLKALYSVKKDWANFLHAFSDLFPRFCIQIPPENENNSELLKMLNRNLYIILGMLLVSPYQHDRRFFSSLGEYYETYPDSLNKMRPELDDDIFNLLSISYDIISPEQFRNAFVSIRKKVIFGNKSDKSILERVEGFKSISSVGLMKYIDTKKIEDLCSFSSESMSEKYIETFSKNIKKLSIPQEVVYSMFSSYYFNRANELLSIDEVAMQAFMKSFSFPFFFPPALLSRYNFTMTVDDIGKISEDFIIKFFDSFSVVFPKLEDTSIFVNKFLNQINDPILFTSPSREPMRFKAALFCLLATINGATIDMEKEYDTFVTYIISGSTRVVSIILRIISALDGNKCPSLDKIYTFLLNTISTYIMKNENFFSMQTELMKPLQSIFSIIQTLKKLFNNPQSMFYKFINSNLPNTPESFAPAIYAILQNSVEALRPGVTVHFINKNKEQVTGICAGYEGNSLFISTKNGDKKTYRFTQCSNVWCECKVKVDLRVITDFVYYFALFSIPETQLSPAAEVFKYASVLEFMKLSSFFQYCSPEFIQHVIKVDNWNQRIRLDECVSDFFYALKLSTQKIEEISFVAIDEDIIETPISPVAHNCLMNDLSYCNSSSGMLMTMNKEKEFVSSPFHVSSKFSLSFGIYPSQSIETEYPMLVKVIAYSKVLNVFLESKTINIRCNLSENRTMKINYNPLEGVYVMIVDDIVIQEVAVPPSASLLFVDICLEPSMIIDYSLESEHKVFEFHACKDLSLYTMHVSSENSICPITDSSLYNYVELCVASKRVEICFKQMILVELALNKRLTLPPDAVLSVLSSLNSSSYGLPLDLMKTPLETLFYFSEKQIFNLIKTMKVDHSAIVDYIESLTENLSSLGYMLTGCHSALVVPSDSLIKASNCALITEKNFREIGFSSELLRIKNTTCLIPSSSFEGTYSQILTYIHYYIAIMIRDGDYNFTAMKHMLETLQEKLPCLEMKIHDVLSIINLLAPSLPDEHKYPVFSPLSFLIPESLVHMHPQLFLAPSIAKMICMPTEGKEKDLIFSDKCPHALIEAKGGPITVIEGNNRTHLNEKEFTIVSSNCSIDYEEEGSAYSVFYIHDYLTVAKELPQWRSHHTHQLICAFSDTIKRHHYNIHPLSSRFSYETALFVLSLTKTIKDTNLFELNRHMIKRTGPVKIEIEKNLMNMNYCSLISDSSHSTPERISYVTTVKILEKSPVDAHLARISPFYPFSKELHDKLVNEIFGTCKTSKRKSFAFHWLKTFLKKSSTQVVMQFIEFVNAKYGLRSLHHSPIYMLLSNIPNIIETVQNESIIILGKFTEEEKFTNLLKEKLQKFFDSRFDN